MPDEYIFVYGTLRKRTATHMHEVLARHCDYHCDGTMQGKLYEVDGYPGIVESDEASDRVYGELYRIIDRDWVLSQLDEYEQCAERFPEPHEYVRMKISIRSAKDGELTAWVYVFNHDVTDLTQIESGDYADQSTAAKSRNV